MLVIKGQVDWIGLDWIRLDLPACRLELDPRRFSVGFELRKPSPRDSMRLSGYKFLKKVGCIS